MPTDNSSPFWVVWNPSHGAPTFRHGSATSSHDEAQRLARANPGQQFIVLRAESGYRTCEPLQRTDFNEPPF